MSRGKTPMGRRTPGSTKEPSKSGSKEKPSELGGATQGRVPDFGAIGKAAPDPRDLPGNDVAYQEGVEEGYADKAVARSETPFILRHFVGEVPLQYRIAFGLVILLILTILALAYLSGPEGSKEALSYLLEILKVVAGGVAGGLAVNVRKGPNGKL